MGIAFGSSLLAQSPSISYPSARRADVMDDYFGTKVADPYRWMEDLNSPELKHWVDAENALAIGYLDGLQQRGALKARITELWNYPKVTPAIRRRALVLQPEHRPAAAVRHIHARDIGRPGNGRARSEQPVAGRFDCSLIV
jgi:hypothetical protein